jgi:hypothetical protein
MGSWGSLLNSFGGNSHWMQGQVWMVELGVVLKTFEL